MPHQLQLFLHASEVSAAERAEIFGAAEAAAVRGDRPFSYAPHREPLIGMWMHAVIHPVAKMPTIRPRQNDKG